jgi:hypothetical protein
MIDRIGAVFFIIFGLGFSLFHKSMAQFAITMWGKRLNIKPPSTTGYQILFLVLGIFFVVMGILALFRK